jgi:hypothetical protein
MEVDSSDQFEIIAKNCPELMEKSRIGEYIGIGAGWYSIIHALCELIYRPVANAKFRLQASIKYPRDETGAYQQQCEAEFDQAVENLPVISDIKEKFGTLRFYADNADERVHSLIEFAEEMSGVMCEVCGKPGSIDDNGWIKTHCSEHRRGDTDDDQLQIEEGTVSPKFDAGE